MEGKKGDDDFFSSSTSCLTTSIDSTAFGIGTCWGCCCLTTFSSPPPSPLTFGVDATVGAVEEDFFSAALAALAAFDNFPVFSPPPLLEFRVLAVVVEEDAEGGNKALPGIDKVLVLTKTTEEFDFGLGVDVDFDSGVGVGSEGVGGVGEEVGVAAAAASCADLIAQTLTLGFGAAGGGGGGDEGNSATAVGDSVEGANDWEGMGVSGRVDGGAAEGVGDCLMVAGGVGV